MLHKLVAFVLTHAKKPNVCFFVGVGLSKSRDLQHLFLVYVRAWYINGRQGEHDPPAIQDETQDFGGLKSLVIVRLEES